MPSSDECDAGSTSTPRALVRTEAITADLDDALRRWSVNKEIPRSDATAPAHAHTNRVVIGVNFGDPLSYDCEADLKRRLAKGPPIWVEDKHGLPIPEDDTHISSVWMAADGKEYSAKLRAMTMRPRPQPADFIAFEPPAEGVPACGARAARVAFSEGESR